MKTCVITAVILLLLLGSCDLFIPPEEDTTRPTVSLTFPLDGSTLSGTVPLAAQASDNVGVFKVVFKVGGLVVGEDQSAPYSVNWDSSSFSLGATVLSATAYDLSGNSKESAVVNITLVSAGAGNLYESFDTYSTGILQLGDLSDAWLNGSFGNAQFSITEDSTGAGKGNLLSISDPGDSGDFVAAQVLFSGTAEGSFQADVYIRENSHINFFLVYSEESSDDIMPVATGFAPNSGGTEMRGFYFDDETSYNSTLSVVSLGTWINLRVDFDCSIDQFAYYINDTLVDTGLLFSDSVDLINGLGFSSADGSGGICQIFLNDLKISSKEVTFLTTETTPASPTNLSATMVSENSVNLSWTDNSNNETGFRIFRFQDSTDYSDMEVIGNPTANSTSFSDTGLTPGETYHYTIVSTLGDEFSDFDSTAYDFVTLLGSVNNLSASNGEYLDKIELSWTAVPYSDGYAVYRRIYNSGNDWDLIALETSSNSLSNSISYPEGFEIINGETYEYEVWSYDYVSSTEGYVTGPSSIDLGWTLELSIGYSRSNVLGGSNTWVNLNADGSYTKDSNILDPVSSNISPEEVMEFYHLCQTHDLFRESWSGSDIAKILTQYTISIGVTEYEIPNGSLTTEELADFNAIDSFFCSLIAPPTPSNLTASYLDFPHHIELDWSPSAGTSYYRIYTSGSSDGEYSYSGNIDHADGFYYDSEESTDTIYFKISAIDSFGFESQKSSSESGKALDATFIGSKYVTTTPSWMTYQTGSTGSYNLNWSNGTFDTRVVLYKNNDFTTILGAASGSINSCSASLNAGDRLYIKVYMLSGSTKSILFSLNTTSVPLF